VIGAVTTMPRHAGKVAAGALPAALVAGLGLPALGGLIFLAVLMLGTACWVIGSEDRTARLSRILLAWRATPTAWLPSAPPRCPHPRPARDAGPCRGAHEHDSSPSGCSILAIWEQRGGAPDLAAGAVSSSHAWCRAADISGPSQWRPAPSGGRTTASWPAGQLPDHVTGVPPGNGVPLLDADETAAAMWARYQEAAGIKDSTAARKLTAVSSFYSWCARRGHVRANPVAGCPGPPSTTTPRPPPA
jgi:hypothetical protein